MKTKQDCQHTWRFFAIVDRGPHGFTWQWQKPCKKPKKALVIGPAFDYYFDCVSDARQNGYNGPLPAGPKVPLKPGAFEVKCGVPPPEPESFPCELLLSVAPLASSELATQRKSSSPPTRKGQRSARLEKCG